QNTDLQKIQTPKIDIHPLIQELKMDPLEEVYVKTVNIDKNSTGNQLSAIKLNSILYELSKRKLLVGIRIESSSKKRHSEILPEILKKYKNITKQKVYELASSQIYDEMLYYLSEDKILRIKTYSANKLSKLIDTQIDTIIYEVSRITKKCSTNLPLREKISRSHMTNSEPSHNQDSDISEIQ
ncbi:15350_t:CDS:2, partial [Racocetra persica]